jgi:hypothetical protein
MVIFLIFGSLCGGPVRIEEAGAVSDCGIGTLLRFFDFALLRGLPGGRQRAGA